MSLFEWISCSAQLPDADQTVLTFAPGSDDPVWPGYHDGEQWWDISGCALPSRRVTHWMPFPDPPEVPSDPSDKSDPSDQDAEETMP